jgi:hypothetical protein
MTRQDSIAPAPGKPVVASPELLRDLAASIDAVQRLEVALHEMTTALVSLRQKPVKQTTLTLSTMARKMAREGYRHLRIWPQESCTLQADTSIGLITVALASGQWNVVDLPDDCTLTAITPATVNVLIEHTDF